MAASLAQKSIQRVNPFAAPSGDDPLAGEDGDGTKSTRIRRPTVKLDEDRLLNHPDGFQKLIPLAKAFKAGPKGSEVSLNARFTCEEYLWNEAEMDDVL